MSETIVSAAGIGTRVVRSGSGDPVVFVHGGHGGANDVALDSTVWATVAAAFAERFEAIVYDRPGCGGSDAPPDDAALTPDGDVEHAAALLASLGRAPYHLVGHGTGAYVTCRLALLYPHLVRSCVFAGSAALAPGVSAQFILDDAPLPRLSRESQRWVLEAQMYAKAVDDAWLDACVAASGAAGFRRAHAKLQGGLERTQFATALGRGRIDTYRRLVNDGLPVPVLLVWGRQDPIVTVEQARLLLEALAGKQRAASLRVINEAGQFVFREQPEAFCRAVRTFLSGSAAS